MALDIPDINSAKQKRLDNVARKLGAFDSAREALEYAVVLARQEGASWSEIALALDMTKQGAQQRYGRLDITANLLTKSTVK